MAIYILRHTSLSWMLFMLGLPVVRATKISPPSRGRTWSWCWKNYEGEWKITRPKSCMETCMERPPLSSRRWRWSTPWCSSSTGTTSRSSTASGIDAHGGLPPGGPDGMSLMLIYHLCWWWWIIWWWLYDRTSLFSLKPLWRDLARSKSKRKCGIGGQYFFGTHIVWNLVVETYI